MQPLFYSGNGVSEQQTLSQMVAQLRFWTWQGALSPKVLEQALIFLDVVPDRALWCTVLGRVLLQSALLLIGGMLYGLSLTEPWGISQDYVWLAMLLLILVWMRNPVNFAKDPVSMPMLLHQLDEAGYDVPSNLVAKTMVAEKPTRMAVVWVAAISSVVVWGGAIFAVYHADWPMTVTMPLLAVLGLSLAFYCRNAASSVCQGLVYTSGLVGTALCAYSVERHFFPNALHVLVGLAGVCVLVFLLFTRSSLRYFLAVCATLSLTALLHYIGYGMVATALSAMMAVWIWQNESTWSALDLHYSLRALGYGAVASCLSGPIMHRVNYGIYWFAPEVWPWDAIIIGGALLINVAINVRRCELPKLSMGTLLPLTAALLIVILLWSEPGILASLLILSLAYRRGNAVLRYMGAVALVVYVFQAIDRHWDAPWLLPSLMLATVVVLALAWNVSRYQPGERTI